MSDDFSFFAGLILALVQMATPVIVVLLIVHFVRKGNRERAERKADEEREQARKQAREQDREQARITPLTLSDPTCKALVDEVVAVMNDMLEIGYEAHVYSSEYSGMISVLPRYCQAAGSSIAAYKVQISMLSVGDLRDGINTYPKRYYSSENSEKLDRFVSRYGSCHNRNDNAYVYQTKATIILPKDNQQKQDALTLLLHEQILQRCPLAEGLYDKTAFYSKNVLH